MTDTAIPTNTKNARVAVVTITNGAVTNRGRVAAVTEAMMGHQRRSDGRHSRPTRRRHMSQGT
jgi:hypothetical protein